MDFRVRGWLGIQFCLLRAMNHHAAYLLNAAIETATLMFMYVGQGSFYILCCFMLLKLCLVCLILVRYVQLVTVHLVRKLASSGAS